MSLISGLQASAGVKLIWSALVLIVIRWWGLAYHKARKLRNIPTVGSSWPILSAIASFQFLTDSRKAMKIGTSKGPIFKVSNLLEWTVVVTDPKHIEDMRMAPDTVLSSFDALRELVQGHFTLGPQIFDNPYHLSIIKAQLQRALPILIPDVHEEVAHAFHQYVPVTEDWTSVKIADISRRIVTRASNRIFVGLPLCRDPVYVELIVQFVNDMLISGTTIRLFPVVLRRLAHALFSTVSKHIDSALNLLEPLMSERRAAIAGKRANFEKPSDMLYWMMEDAKGEETEDRPLAIRILALNFVAIHSSSMTFTHAFYWLATYPEYLGILREEIEEVVKREGAWTKEAVDQMHKLDSFLKESQRLSPIVILTMMRNAVKDFTFSDGTTVPAGTNIGVLTNTHMNEKTYENPHEFDPLRFVKMTKQAEADGNHQKKFDVVSTSADHLAFGLGRHSCTGRFFASSEIKMMLAHIILTYDVKLENGVRPPDVWSSIGCIPNPSAEVLFRKRQ